VQNKGLDTQTVIDGMGQGVLIFDRLNRLVLDNRAARTFLGADYKAVRDEGWSAAAMLFNTRQHDPDQTIDSVRARALDADRPVRFYTYRAGERIPCWASAVQGQGSDVFTMITIDTPDWAALNELVTRYVTEVREAVQSTQGHAELIARTLKQSKADGTEQLSKRLSGFVRLIDVHMHRLQQLTDMVQRLEAVRTGSLREAIRFGRRKVVLLDFVEDFMEELDERKLLDPETDAADYRSRVTLDIPYDLTVAASPSHLTPVLRDLLRNALMYSLKAAPIRLNAAAHPKDNSAQIDVVDEGYGIRAGEVEKIFMPFSRARQPQIMSEFGYGLSLYLCKHEVEAMGGRIWFTSEEGVGTTFSIKLPLWKDGV
jgi:signal transduction histidine kinase